MNWLCPTTARAAESLGDVTGTRILVGGLTAGPVGAVIGALMGKKKKKAKKKAVGVQTMFGVPVTDISSVGPGGEAISSDPATRYAYLIRLRDAGWTYAIGQGWRPASVAPIPPTPSPTGGYALPDATLPAVGPLAPPIPAKDLTTMLIIGMVGIAAVAILPGLLKRRG